MRHMHVKITDENITITCEKLPRHKATVEAGQLPAEWTQEKLESAFEVVFHCYEAGAIETPEKLFKVCAGAIVGIKNTFARQNQIN